VIEILPGRSSGSFPVQHLPVPAEQWLKNEPLQAAACGTYSYGDSAGLAPDFPFNPALRGPSDRKTNGAQGFAERNSEFLSPTAILSVGSFYVVYL
jgi:hypothetical protein